MNQQITKRRVLFVCMGNICRSPTGEGVMRKVVADRGVSNRIEVDSAGTIGFHMGEPADARMRQAASRRGYNLDSRARQIEAADLDTFDLIVAMDRENLAGIHRLENGNDHAHKIKLLSEYLDDTWEIDVPDPYYGGESGFEHVMDMIEEACPAILGELLK
ncbi:MAG: low molecular weight protein-tyrosine-phosphatase [Planctomycetota bacterium]|jgi:protein-tyrosine phosphatase